MNKQRRVTIMDVDLAYVESMRKSPEVKTLVDKLHKLIDEEMSKYDHGQDETKNEFHNRINLFHAAVIEGKIMDISSFPDPLVAIMQRTLANGIAMGYLLAKGES